MLFRSGPAPVGAGPSLTATVEAAKKWSPRFGAARSVQNGPAASPAGQPGRPEAARWQKTVPTFHPCPSLRFLFLALVWRKESKFIDGRFCLFVPIAEIVNEVDVISPIFPQKQAFVGTLILSFHRQSEFAGGQGFCSAKTLGRAKGAARLRSQRKLAELQTA